MRVALDKINKCIKNKDINCLIDNLYAHPSSNKVEAEKAKVKKKFLIRYILDDPKTCMIFKNTRSKEYEDDNHIPKGLEKKVNQERSTVWDSLEKAVSLDLNYNYVHISLRKHKEGFDSLSG